MSDLLKTLDSWEAELENLKNQFEGLRSIANEAGTFSQGYPLKARILTLTKALRFSVRVLNQLSKHPAYPAICRAQMVDALEQIEAVMKGEDGG